MKLLNKLFVKLRPWNLGDVEFCLKVRNHPELMRWYRQDVPLSYWEQYKFIRWDMSAAGTYNGHIIEFHGEPVGLCGVKNSGEFCIGLLPEHHGKGIAKATMQQLMRPGVWSEVFIGNPALEFFISLGFKIKSVRTNAYFKNGVGYVDVAKIECA